MDWWYGEVIEAEKVETQDSGRFEGFDDGVVFRAAFGRCGQRLPLISQSRQSNIGI